MHLRPALVWYWLNLAREYTRERVDMKQEVQIINEGGSIIISHYIIHGGYCQDINHCCRKWLNNCHKSQLNTIHRLNPPFPINILYVEMTRVCFFLLTAFGILCWKDVSEESGFCCWSMVLLSAYALQSFISTNTHTLQKTSTAIIIRSASSPTQTDWYLNGWFSRTACSRYILQHIPPSSRSLKIKDL